jgi:predicted transcriptional regulator
MEIKKQMLELDRKSGVICILLALHTHKELRAMELLNMIHISRDTFYRSTGEWMTQNGLMKVVPNVDERIFVFQITEKGRKIAEHLSEIEKIL